MYLSDENDHLNDVTVLIKEDVVSKLVAQGMSRGLARHFGHLFTHDPLIVLEEQLSSKDQLSTYHFDVCFLSLGFLFIHGEYLELEYSSLAFSSIQTTTIR